MTDTNTPNLTLVWGTVANRDGSPFEIQVPLPDGGTLRCTVDIALALRPVVVTAPAQPAEDETAPPADDRGTVIKLRPASMQMRGQKLNG